MAIAAAAAAAVHPSPPALAWRTVASLVCTHLAWAAVDAVICLFLASMWLLFGGQATMVIGLVACGEGCAVVTAGFKVFSVAAGVSLVLVLFFAVLLVAAEACAQAAEARAQAAEATDIEARKEPAPETSAARDRLCDSLALGLLAATAFALLIPIGVLVIVSRRERMGSVIFDVGALGTVMVNCFVLCPIMTVRIWRAWMMARAWRKARHAL